MNVVLVHPTHGAKVAINEKEIEMDEKNGWVRYNPNTLVEPQQVIEKPIRNKLARKSDESPSLLIDKVPEFLGN